MKQVTTTKLIDILMLYACIIKTCNFKSNLQLSHWNQNPVMNDVFEKAHAWALDTSWSSLTVLFGWCFKKAWLHREKLLSKLSLPESIKILADKKTVMLFIAYRPTWPSNRLWSMNQGSERQRAKNSQVSIH